MKQVTEQLYETPVERRDERALKEKVSVTLDSDLVSKLKVLAVNDDRSFSQYVNLVLKDHIRNTPERN